VSTVTSSLPLLGSAFQRRTFPLPLGSRNVLGLCYHLPIETAHNYWTAAVLWVTDPPTNSKSKSLYDWRFTANQFVLARSSLRFTIRDFFLRLNPCGQSPHVTSSPTKGWVYLLWICLSFFKCSYLTYSMLLKILASALYIQILCQSRLCKADHAYLTANSIQSQLAWFNISAWTA
jgi:hypothetical protein